MKTIQVEIEGTAPLLQNKMSIETEASLENVVKKRHGQPKGEDPERLLYKLDGKICQPAEHIFQAICKQMGNYKIQGRGKKSYKEMAQGALEVVPEYIVHKNQKWVVDVRTVVIPSTRGRVVKRRPRFNEWQLAFQINILNDDLPESVVKSALDDAGAMSGIGDYRPRFGRFIVTKFKS